MKKTIMDFTECFDNKSGIDIIEHFPENLTEVEKQTLLEHLELCPYCAEVMEFHEIITEYFKIKSNFLIVTWLDDFYRAAAKTREQNRIHFKDDFPMEIVTLEFPIPLTIICNGKEIGHIDLINENDLGLCNVLHGGDYELVIDPSIKIWHGSFKDDQIKSNAELVLSSGANKKDEKPTYFKNILNLFTLELYTGSKFGVIQIKKILKSNQ